MAKYILSAEVKRDLAGIYGFSSDEFGEKVADAYILSLHEAFQTLAAQPGLARKVDFIKPDYLRFERGSHSIYFRRRRGGIFIVRVLHRRMDALRHL